VLREGRPRTLGHSALTPRSTCSSTCPTIYRCLSSPRLAIASPGASPGPRASTPSTRSSSGCSRASLSCLPAPLRCHSGSGVWLRTMLAPRPRRCSVTAQVHRTDCSATPADHRREGAARPALRFTFRRAIRIGSHSIVDLTHGRSSQATHVRLACRTAQCSRLPIYRARPGITAPHLNRSAQSHLPLLR
jgi:hypothetical protein